MKVALLMGIWNEAGRIEACLDHHSKYFDEIVIVIQKSTDGTEKIVEDWKRKYRDNDTFKILYFPQMGCSEATLQDGVDIIVSDWILYCDADEKFPERFLKVDMRAIIQSKNYDGYRFERDNWFDVQVFNEAVPIEPKRLLVKHPARDQQVRLTRRSVSVFPRQIHVRARVRGADGQEKIYTLSHSIYHLKTLEEQWSDNASYLPAVKAVEEMERKKRSEV